MKKSFYLLLFLNLLTQLIHSQYDDPLKGKVFVSPDFGLVLGSINRIEVSPSVGYFLTDRIALAGGFKYEFYSVTRNYYSVDPVKTHIFGSRVFMRYFLIENIQDFLPFVANTSILLHAEIESSSLERKYFRLNSQSEKGRFWYTTGLLGGGISQTASDRMQFNFLILMDINEANSPLYTNPIIRFGMIYFINFPKLT